MEAVDEEQLEHDVRDVRDDDDLERAAQVGDAAQIALARKRDQRGRQSHRRGSEVDERLVARLSVRPETAENRPGERLEQHEQDHADAERHPERLGRQASCPLVLAGAGGPRHEGRRAVREEVEDREGR